MLKLQLIIKKKIFKKKTLIFLKPLIIIYNRFINSVNLYSKTYLLYFIILNINMFNL